MYVILQVVRFKSSSINRIIKRMDLNKTEQRARSRKNQLLFGFIMLGITASCAILITITVGWQNSVSWFDDFDFTRAHIPFFVFLVSGLAAFIAFEGIETGEQLEIVQDKLNEFGAELFKDTTGRNIYVFRSQGRIVYLHVIHGDDNDTTGGEELLLTSQDVVFDTNETTIKTAKIYKSLIPENEWTPVGDAAFDKYFIVSTDNPEFIKKMLTPEVKEGLLTLKRYFPSVEFVSPKEPLVDRLTASHGSQLDNPSETHCDLTIEINGWPKTDGALETFLKVSFSLLHATGYPERPIDEGNDQPQEGTEEHSRGLSGDDLIEAKHKVRSRRFALGMGILTLAVGLFSGVFITVTRGLEGWLSSLSWIHGLDFTSDHVPFFFFLVPTVIALFCLYQAYHGYRLQYAVSQSPGYIDFDKIRRRWPERFRDRLSVGIHDLFMVLILFIVLLGIVWFIMWAGKAVFNLFV